MCTQAGQLEIQLWIMHSFVEQLFPLGQGVDGTSGSRCHLCDIENIFKTQGEEEYFRDCIKSGN